jgi:Clp amino terminal domain, pathogenicity island component
VFELFSAAARRVVSHAGEESDRLGHFYIGPEHLLVGLLVEGDDVAASTLVAHGVDLSSVRTDIANLVASGRLAAPGSRQHELLQSFGIDLDSMRGRMEAVFGDQAVIHATTRVMGRRRPRSCQIPVWPPLPRGGKAFVVKRALHLAGGEADAHGERIVEPGHLLIGLLRDGHDPVGAQMSRRSRREAPRLGLPTSGPHVIRQIIEVHGLPLEALTQAAVDALYSPT